MKRLGLIFSFFSLLVLLTACGNPNKARLKAEIEAGDKECPISLGMVGDLLRMSYDESADMIKFYITINDDNLSVEALKKNEDLALNALRLAFSQDDSKELISLIVSAGASLEVTYKSAQTANSIDLQLPNDELKKIINNPLSKEETNRMLLENQMALENARCPYYIQEGMEMIKAGHEGKNVVYTYRMDEDMFDMSILQNRKDILKGSIKESFNNSYMTRQARILSSLGKGLVCRFCGNRSGKTVEIEISDSELKGF